MTALASRLHFSPHVTFASNKTLFKKLNDVADVIRKLNPGELDMNNWGTCVLGHYAKSGVDKSFFLYHVVSDCPFPVYRIYMGWDAAAVYFDVNNYWLHFLFGYDNEPTKEDALASIAATKFAFRLNAWYNFFTKSRTLPTLPKFSFPKFQLPTFPSLSLERFIYSPLS